MNHRPSFLEPLEHRRLLASSISIGTVVDTAMRQTAQDGLIVVSRKGDLSEPLVVPLIVGGTAQNVVEYGRIGPQLTIPAGENSVAIPVRPVYPGPAGESNYVTVSLGQIDGIRYGNDTASVNIVDNPDSTPPQFVTAPPTTPARFFVDLQQRRDHSAFLIRRTGRVDAREVVDINVGGDAENGVDFGRIGDRVVFEAGQTTIILPVRRPEPSFTGNRSLTVALPGAVPVTESTLILNGLDLSGDLNPIDPIADRPDPVFPGPGRGVGFDPTNPGLDTGVGFDPTDDNGLGTGVGIDPSENDLDFGVGLDRDFGMGLGTGFIGNGVAIGIGAGIGNTSTLPGAVPTTRRG